jgi:hypothetical protein
LSSYVDLYKNKYEGMMLRTDEEQKVQAVEIKRGGGGAYIKQRAYGDGESVLKYLKSILWAAERESSRNLKGYPYCG